MLSINPPGLSFVDVYTACVQHRRSPTLRNNLTAEWPRVSNRAALYQNRAIQGQLFSIPEEEPTIVTMTALCSLYDDVLVRSERPTYDAIISGSPYRRCPFCGTGFVRTVDHYLPKETFPDFALLPVNLLPSCMDCNKIKHVYNAQTEDTQLFHPYFDNWSEYDFLRAEVIVSDGIDITYYIDETALPENLANRAANHFEVFQLDSLFSAYAARELVSKKTDFALTFGDGDSESLRIDLQQESASRSQFGRNTWQSVLFRELALSEPFYQGGFTHIESPVVVES